MAKKRKTELDIETGTMPAMPPPVESAAPVSLEQEMAQDVASAQAPRKPFNKTAIIVAGAVVALVLAVVITVTVIQKKKTSVAHKKGEEHGEKAKGAEKQPPKAEAEIKFKKVNNLVLEPFVIPYKDKGQDGFIQIVFALQVDDPEVIDEINGNLPLIRNSVLFAISTRPQEDLIDPVKRQALMKDIRFNVDRSLQTGRVEAVLLNAINVY